jgi:surface polysaccharide O-acyltransferase-like enzyme
VDLIRTVAIIAVIVYHVSNEQYSQIQLTDMQYFVKFWASNICESIVLIGVPLFVMLSGALLLQPNKVNEPIRVFLKKRLSRIGLAFVFWSIVYFAWAYFVNNANLTVYSIIQSLFSGGAYFQFWFIYLIFGLYLITPILRVLVAHANRKILRYLIILWFTGVAIVPLFHLVTGLAVDENVFLFGGYIGYFILGTYLLETQVDTKILHRVLLASVLATIIGSWLMVYPFHSAGQYFFFAYTLSANVIITSVAIFMLLSKYPSDWPTKKHPILKKIVQAISQNTLPIFLIHVLILESLNKGFFGFQLSLTVISPIIEIPLASAATLLISLGIVLAMKKVPVLRKLIG